jgi:hypothetical protein
MSAFRLVLTAHLTQFLNGNYTVGSPLGFADESPTYNLETFLKDPTESLYPVVVNILQAFVNKCQTVSYPSTSTYRVVATLPDGTVWFDSAKVNTWANFTSKTINENHNTRRPFMEVLLNDDQFAHEIKNSVSTGYTESRVCMRVGDSRDTPLGVIALSSTLGS